MIAAGRDNRAGGPRRLDHALRAELLRRHLRATYTRRRWTWHLTAVDLVLGTGWKGGGGLGAWHRLEGVGEDLVLCTGWKGGEDLVRGTGWKEKG